MFVENYPQSGHHLVYNTLSRAFLEIDNQSLSMLYSLSKQEPPDSAKPVIQKLQAQGVIVEDEKDEALSFNRMFERQRAESHQLHATILTTYDCPMSCVYCYQKHVKNGGYMSIDTMQRTANWLEEQIQNEGIDRCSITFYGGEPLMNFTPIEYIGKRTKKYCRDNEIKLGFAMVTSGILLTPEIADKLKRIGVKHLQITLDGDKETHDRRRPRKDGSGTFDLIMENLCHLVDDFSITILSNVDRTNLESACRLIDTMYSLGYAGKMRIIFGPVSASLELAQKLHLTCPQTANRDLLSLTLYAADKGFAADLRPGLKICGMLLPHHLVISPDGKLYTCPIFLDMDEYQAGSIESDNVEFRKLDSFTLDKECLECLYVPFCTGGCRYNAHVEQGDIQAIDCQKETFSYSTPQLLKTHYALRNKNVKSSDPTEGYLIPEGTSLRNGRGDIVCDRDHRAVSQKLQK
jgi:uncharacterized protein